MVRPQALTPGASRRPGVSQEKKYCADCQEVITAKSDLALPGADIGINATVLVCYLWVAICLPFNINIIDCNIGRRCWIFIADRIGGYAPGVGPQ